MQPHQVISLEDLPGRSASPLADHWDHVHIGFYPVPSSGYQAPSSMPSAGRIDQGVDFVGTGPIKAIGKARILKVGAPGWPGGGGVLYRLLDGSQAGSVIFVYEGISPTVHAGELVLRRASRSAASSRAARPGSRSGSPTASGVPLSHATYHEGDVDALGPQDGCLPVEHRRSGPAERPVQPAAEAQAMEQGDPAPRADPEPDRAHLAVAVLAPRASALQEALQRMATNRASSGD